MSRLWNTSYTQLFLYLSAVYVSARVGYGPGEQDWDYVDVREGAHMFYWLYYTTANVANYTERPLAIWLQGGPGGSSTGYGNFEELGPLDLNGNYRNTTWVKDMNVLFIDNPVGSGFSYVDTDLDFTTNNSQIATDLVSFMKGFYALHPEFEVVPLHIFSQSYGGKMAPEFALELYKAIERGEIRSNLKSVALGNPWTSPVDSILSWAPFLLQLGIVDHDGYASIQADVAKTEMYARNGLWLSSTSQWNKNQLLVLNVSRNVDFYNVLQHKREARKRSEKSKDTILRELMQGAVTDALNISAGVDWSAQTRKTFKYLEDDFMKSAVHIVSELLNSTNIKVGVYSGQLDLICATPGTVNWIDNMDWADKSAYLAAKRNAFYVDGVLEGYEKSAGRFSMFWVSRAGHAVPADNPAAMAHILRVLTNV